MSSSNNRLRRRSDKPRDILESLTGDEVDNSAALEFVQSVLEDVVEKWVVRVEGNPDHMEAARRDISAAMRVLRQTRYLAARGPEIRAGLQFVDECRDDPAVKALLDAFPGSQVTKIEGAADDADNQGATGPGPDEL